MSAEPKSSGRNIQQLKELMLFEEQQELEELRLRLRELEENGVERLAEDLAEVLRRRRSLGDDSFEEYVAALQEGTESAIQLSVSEDKSRLAKALFPIMGPAIRSYVAELFRGMAAELNESIKNTTSVERIKWRAEAKLAGKPYSEYVLLKTQSFRIEEVYLMQRDTGLLLLHASIDPDSEANEEADLVSGMFTAIRSFVKDTFVHSSDGQAEDDKEDDELDSFTFGEREVLIEVGPSMVLAAVAHGVPSLSLRDDLTAILENLHAEMQGKLDQFSGDMSELESSRPTLRTALLERKVTPDTNSGGLWRAWVVLGVLAAGFAVWTFFGFRENQRWTEFETALRDQPGVSVTEVTPSGWWRHRQVTGVRDPLAVEPAVFAENYPINPAKTKFRFELVESLHPTIAALRAEQLADEKKALDERIQAFEKRLADTEGGFAEQVAAVKTEVTGVNAKLNTEVTSVKSAIEAEREARSERTQKILESLVRSQFGDVDGLEIEFREDGGMAFKGSIQEPQFSALKARMEPLKSLGGIVETSELKNGTAARVDELTKAIAETAIAFQSGSLSQGDEARIDVLSDLAVELNSTASFVGRSFRFVVIAHPLIGTNRSANRNVEESRAKQVRDNLIRSGIPVERVTAELSENMDKEGLGVRVQPVEIQSGTQ